MQPLREGVEVSGEALKSPDRVEITIRRYRNNVKGSTDIDPRSMRMNNRKSLRTSFYWHCNPPSSKMDWEAE
jgi:hypothetical protein